MYLNNNKISVILLEPRICLTFLLTLKSLLFQSYKSLEILIFSTDVSKLNYYLSKNNLTSSKISLLSYNPEITVNSLLHIVQGNYIVFNDYRTLSTRNRFKKQLSFMKASNLEIVSCLSLPSINDFNSYSDNNIIDSAVSGGSLPIDISSLLMDTKLFKKAFYKSNIKINCYNAIILQLLKYSSITKLRNRLYIPLYKYVYDSALEVFNFNKNNPIKYRNYLIEASKNATNFPKDDLYENKHTILMIIDSINIGGTETYLLSLSLGLKKLGYSVIIATCDGIGIEVFRLNNIDILTISNNKNIALEEIDNIINKYNIDIIHSHLPYSIELSTDINHLKKIPYVVTLHGMFYNNDLLESISNSASKIIAVSNPIFKTLHHNRNSTMVYNGINISSIEKYIFNNTSKQVITYCSRLDYAKGSLAEKFLNDIYPLLLNNPNIVSYIIGDGFKFNSIEIIANSINENLSREAIILYGAVYDAKEIFFQSSIVIGTGRVILEAMSLKKPVIALGLKGLVGIVDINNYIDMINIYFGDHDYLDLTNGLSLVEMISSILNNKTYANSLSEFNRYLCDLYFNEDTITNKIASVYEDILK